MDLGLLASHRREKIARCVVAVLDEAEIVMNDRGCYGLHFSC
jgi:hypothetical protein